MRRRCAAYIALLVSLATAAHAGTEWRERLGQARFEGVLTDELVSGNDVELLGVQLVGRSAPRETGKTVHLIVARGDAVEDLEVEVRELPSNYMMKPRKRTRPSPHFQWPSGDVIVPAGVSLARLGAVASDRRQDLYLPVYVGPSDTLPEPAEYRFAFYLRAPHAHRWTLYEEQDGRLLAIAEGEGSGEEGLLEILWDGRKSGGEPARAGARHRLRVHFELYADTTRRPPPFDVPFETLPGAGAPRS